MMKQRTRIVAFFGAVLLFIMSVPFASFATENAPSIGTAQNVVSKAKITLAGKDVTGQYAKNGKIIFANNQEGFINNLIFGSDNSFVYSARVGMSDLSFQKKNHGSVRLILGTGKDEEGVRRSMELCVRPGINQVCFFMRKDTSEKNLAPVQGMQGLKKQAEYIYTVEYAGGKVTFWVNDGTSVVKVYDKVDVTGTLSEIELAPGFNARGCLGEDDEDASISEIQIWGKNVSVLAPPELTVADQDLIKQVAVLDVFTGSMYKLTGGKLASTANKTGRIDFKGVKLNGDYRLYANGKFEDNKNVTAEGKEYDWERLIFRVASAEKDGEKYTIEVRVGAKAIYVYAFAQAGKEKMLQSISTPNAYGEAKSYVLDYHKDGTFDFWQNGSRIFHNFAPASSGYNNVIPALGLGAEVCSFTYNNLHLVSKTATLTASVPQIPSGNGNYGKYMYIRSNDVVTGEGSTAKSVTDKKAGSTEFDCLPFGGGDTFVYGFRVRVDKADETWQGPRFMIGKDESGNTLYLYMTQGSLMVISKDKNGKDKKIAAADFTRKLKTEYRIDMLLAPTSLSVWVNDILLIDNVTTPRRSQANMGILFEKTIATVDNIDFYYTTPVKFVKPVVPEKPVYKKIGKGQFNGADWMSVSLNGSKFGYFGNTLKAPVTVGGTRTVSPKYLFENIPVEDDMSYYYSATYKVNVRKEVWQGPRFIVRHIGDTPVYVILTVDTINVLAGSKSAAKASFKSEIGKSYDIMIYTTPTRVSVWMNGTLMIENADLTPFLNGEKTSAKMGLLFENCTAEVTNLAIYGSKIKYDPEMIDPELYYSKEFNMAGIPKMPAGSVNLFSNLTMTTDKKASLGTKYEKEKNRMASQFDTGVEEVSFKDANGSSNLNGLKNKSGYVFRFTHKVDSWTAKSEDFGVENSGFYAIVNSSKVPGGTTENTIKVGLWGKSLKLMVYKTGKAIIDITVPVERQNGKSYDIAIVHGKNWIKVYMDNQLQIVATDLPTYNVNFDFKLSSIKGEFTDFNLYEFENSGLTVLPVTEKADVTKATNTLLGVEGYNFVLSRYKLPIAIAVLGGTVSVLSAVLVVWVLLHGQKQEMAENTSENQENTSEGEEA